MRSTMFLQFLLVVVTYTIAAPQPAPVVENNDINYGLAADIPHSEGSYPAILTACLKANGYQVVFVRGLEHEFDGMFDTDSVAVIQNAVNAGLGVEVYMEPNPNGKIQGGQQLDIMMQGLSKNGIYIRSVWIKVAYSSYIWSSDPVSNTLCINSILTRARQLGLFVGIYTSAADWARFTNNTSVGSDVLLWYYTQPATAPYTGTPTFDDFVPFGGFTALLVKQWSSGYRLPSCNTPSTVYFNQDVYKIGNYTVSAEKSSFVASEGKIVVGGLGL